MLRLSNISRWNFKERNQFKHSDANTYQQRYCSRIRFCFVNGVVVESRVLKFYTDKIHRADIYVTVHKITNITYHMYNLLTDIYPQYSLLKHCVTQ